MSRRQGALRRYAAIEERRRGSEKYHERCLNKETYVCKRPNFCALAHSSGGRFRAASRLIRKALAAGVTFSAENIYDLMDCCDTATMTLLLAAVKCRFTQEQLEDFWGSVDDAVLEKAARRNGVTLFEDEDPEWDDEPWEPEQISEPKLGFWAALEQEQESNQKRLHDLAMMQSRADTQESEVRTFIKEIRRYATIEELDEAVLNRLISRILIGEVKKVDGQKVQEVRIVYNFVGEIPEIAA